MIQYHTVVSVKCNCSCTYLSVVTASQADRIGSTLHIVEMEGHQKISYSLNGGLESDYSSGG